MAHWYWPTFGRGHNARQEKKSKKRQLTPEPWSALEEDKPEELPHMSTPSSEAPHARRFRSGTRVHLNVVYAERGAQQAQLCGVSSDGAGAGRGGAGSRVADPGWASRGGTGRGPVQPASPCRSSLSVSGSTGHPMPVELGAGRFDRHGPAGWAGAGLLDRPRAGPTGQPLPVEPAWRLLKRPAPAG
jgi:hypothetical protein